VLQLRQDFIEILDLQIGLETQRGRIEGKDHTLADRKDEVGVICSTLQRGAVQLIVKRVHRVVTGIIAVTIAAISVVTGEDVTDCISRCHVVRVEVEITP
jgi:hypothetical protein